jgi:hypothetical protein
MIEWENGEITQEPLRVIAADDPISCAIYASENGLLDKTPIEWYSKKQATVETSPYGSVLVAARICVEQIIA